MAMPSALAVLRLTVRSNSLEAKKLNLELERAVKLIGRLLHHLIAADILGVHRHADPRDSRRDVLEQRASLADHFPAAGK